MCQKPPEACMIELTRCIQKIPSIYNDALFSIYNSAQNIYKYNSGQFCESSNEIIISTLESFASSSGRTCGK